MDLDQTYEAITTRADFVLFIKALRIDLQTNPSQWENITLESYLESLSAWVEDIDGYYLNKGLEPPSVTNWKFIANIFYAASVYE